VLLRILVGWGINVLALWVGDALFDSVRIRGVASYVVGAAVLGVANAVIKPVLAILTLPLIIVTLGLFLLVINIAMLALAEWIAPRFSIDGFWTYVAMVVVVWVVNWASQAAIERTRRPRRRNRLLSSP
jgi:putative membrane protein